MSDDTNASASQAPIYTTSVTSTIGRPPRRFYFILQAAVFAATIALAVWGRSLGLTEMKEVSVPTEMFVKVGHALTHPVALASSAFVVIGLGLLALKGVIDGFLKILIWINVLWILVFVAASTSKWWMPLLTSGASGR